MEFFCDPIQIRPKTCAIDIPSSVPLNLCIGFQRDGIHTKNYHFLTRELYSSRKIHINFISPNVICTSYKYCFSNKRSMERLFSRQESGIKQFVHRQPLMSRFNEVEAMEYT